MNKKYFRVIKNNFLWELGAIVKSTIVDESIAYIAIDPIFVKAESDFPEYINSVFIEDNTEYFERVFPVNTENTIKFTDREDAVKETVNNLNK